MIANKKRDKTANCDIMKKFIYFKIESYYTALLTINNKLSSKCVHIFIQERIWKSTNQVQSATPTIALMFHLI